MNSNDNKNKQEYYIQNKFTGSTFILILWVFCFWPMAIVYFMYKRKPVRVKIQNE